MVAPVIGIIGMGESCGTHIAEAGTGIGTATGVTPDGVVNSKNKARRKAGLGSNSGGFFVRNARRQFHSRTSTNRPAIAAAAAIAGDTRCERPL